jgi:hypothetical protein
MEPWPGRSVAGAGTTVKRGRHNRPERTNHLTEEGRHEPTIVNLIIQLVAEAAGGNIAGGLFRQFDLGPLGNSIAGIVGGGIGGQLLDMILTATGSPTGAAPAGSGFDIGSIVAEFAGGGVTAGRYFKHVAPRPRYQP